MKVPSYGGLQTTPTVPYGSVNPTPIKTDGTTQKLASTVDAQAQKDLNEIVRIANETRAKAALLDMENELKETYYGKDGMFSQKGEAVVNQPDGVSFTDKGLKAFDDAASKYTGNLTAAQKNYLRDKLDQYRLKTHNNLITHEVTESNNYTLDVNGTYLKKAVDSLAANGFNAQSRAADISAIRDATATIGKVKGLSQETIKYESDKAVSSALKTVITGLIVNGNEGAAAALFAAEGKKGNITGADAVTLRKAIATAQQARAIENAAKNVAARLDANHDPVNLFAAGLEQSGVAPDWLLSAGGIKTADYKTASRELLQKFGGSIDEASRYVAYVKSAGKHVSVEEYKKDADFWESDGGQEAAKVAKVLADKVVNTPEYGVTANEREIREEIKKQYPNLKEGSKEYASVLTHIAKARQQQRQQIEWVQEDQMKAAIDYIENPDKYKDKPKPETNMLTPKQYQALEVLRDRQARGEKFSDSVLLGEMKCNPALATMSEADFLAETVIFSPTDRKALAIQRNQMQTGQYKIGELKHDVYKKAFDSFVMRNYPQLNDKDMKEHRAYVFAECEKIVSKAASQKNGDMPEDEVYRLLCAQSIISWVGVGQSVERSPSIFSKDQLDIADRSPAAAKALSTASRLLFAVEDPSNRSMVALLRDIEHNVRYDIPMDIVQKSIPNEDIRYLSKVRNKYGRPLSSREYFLMYVGRVMWGVPYPKVDGEEEFSPPTNPAKDYKPSAFSVY